MSDTKLVSPLLDGFLMGDPISEHHGVRCCPAMREETGDKYIVKIISIPSSQKQLDALLLTGAYPDAASAMEYFSEQAEGVVKEAEILKELSKLQGFLPYEGWQAVPMEKNQLGYEVYLLSRYKHTLEKYLKNHTMTHLGAVNLGLDLCAALSICRRAGYMFVDLKPSNIFLSGKREYRIGDLGFAPLNSLKFNSLPSKYCSPYTPPELYDPMSTLNPTADVYAVGMILYQIYNDGRLPFESKAPGKALDAPLNADYEMAEIIQKAIDPNPRKRWQTPIEMGQALVSYMQRNSVNDVPIVPPSVEQDALNQAAADTGDDTEKDTHEDLVFMNTMTKDETAPDVLSGDDQVEGAMSEEVNDMLAQADELLAAELPDEVIVPEAPEIRIPEILLSAEPESELPEDAPAETEEQPQEIPADTLEKLDETPSEPSEEADADDEDEEEVIFTAPKPRKKKGWIVSLILTVLLLLAVYGGIRFYNDYYLMVIDRMEIEGKEDTITVYLNTQVDETMLTVVCTDAYGNTLSMPVVDGAAEFIGLNPATTYKITVEVEGFHALTGVEPCSYTTAEQTKISNFTAKTGTEDGSVILSFAIEGREIQDWMIEYTAEEEETKSVSFTGHSVAISGLTVDKTYTFTLVAPADDPWIIGNPTITYTASKIVVAEKLAITGCVDGVLTAQWKAPADTTVESWTVRCYTDAGYDQTVTTTETNAKFEDIAADKAYTVEVTAAGMTQNARAYVSANPATVTSVQVEASADSFALNVNWDFSGTAPDSGWLLMYAINDGDNQAVIPCDGTSAVIAPRIPGVTYHFSIQAADGSTVFNGQFQYDCVETDPLKENGINSKDVSASLCPTPEKDNWTYKDIGKNDYTSKYAPGSRVSMVLYSPDRAKASEEKYEVMFVICDEQGNVLLDLVKTTTATWDELWNDRSRYCTLDIPAIPGIPGKYTIEVYFNSHRIVEKSLTITE